MPRQSVISELESELTAMNKVDLNIAIGLIIYEYFFIFLERFERVSVFFLFILIESLFSFCFFLMFN